MTPGQCEDDATGLRFEEVLAEEQFEEARDMYPEGDNAEAENYRCSGRAEGRNK